MNFDEVADARKAWRSAAPDLLTSLISRLSISSNCPEGSRNDAGVRSFRTDS
jgi:hypothetical protein